MKYIFSIILIHLCLLSFGQVTFTNAPINKQLVARDLNTSLGTVTVEGTVNSNGVNYDQIQITLNRNGALHSTETQDLNFSNNIAQFTFNATIISELINYELTIHGLTAGSPTLIRTVRDIVAGDVYIVQGQSNAEANERNGSASSNNSNFIRVYASGQDNGSNLQDNNEWYVAQGNGDRNSNGNAGQWGLKIARMLLDDLNIPIAIFNGAHGGQPISFFQAPGDYTTSTNSNYGRMYYRLNKSGLKNSVKAILWSQGEADSFGTGLPTSSYINAFNSLKSAWLNDYPNIEKFYIFQTRDCDCGTSSEGRLKIKEAQRLLAVNDPSIAIMPTTALTLHNDNCHYPYTNGYETFAKRIYPLVKRDIYGENFTQEIDAPMIISAKLLNPTTLELETDAVTLQLNNTSLNDIQQDYLLTNASPATITGIQISGSKIIFTLSQYPGFGRSSSISFIGKNSGALNNITNSNNLELVNFSNLSIQDLSDNGNPPTAGNPPGNGSENTDPKIFNIKNNGKITIKANASLNMKGCVLNPNVDHIITADNTITRDLNSVGEEPNTSLARVYLLSSSLADFTGRIIYYYDNVDLGTASHNDLALYVKDDTDQWITYSDQDTSDNKITYTFVNPIKITSITGIAPDISADDDNDGIENSIDNCIDTANPDQADTDEDGIGDVCDATPNGDDDGDGVDNAIDNCIDIANPDQTDTDEDGIGDICDATPNGDDDGDGVDNTIDTCPNTPLNVNVDTVGCPIFTLPVNNFDITVLSETCPDKNNGQLIITANESYDYVATINSINYTFTNNSVTVPDLEPGNYEVCITVTGETFEQCYNIIINEGAKILGKATLTSNKASINIEKGTAPYNVFVNGKTVLQTMSKNFTIDVSYGDLVVVKTNVQCEGVFSKIIDLFEEVTVFPNPTKGFFEIALPITLKDIKIEIFNINSQLVLSNTYPVINGKAQLNIENMPAAVYFVKIYLENPVTVKIIKN